VPEEMAPKIVEMLSSSYDGNGTTVDFQK
jgi:hypothetical protein